MSRILAGALAVVTALSVSPTLAQARGRGNNGAAQRAARQAMINNLQQTLAGARQTLSAAQAQMSQAQSEIEASKSRVQEAKNSHDSAKSDERSSHQSLDQIEAELFEKAGPTSEIGKAHAEYVEAEDEFKAANDQLFNSSEYKDKVAALESADRAKLLPEIKKEAKSNDSRYQHALARLNLTRTRWKQLRMQMVQNSPEWMAASKSVREAQSEENKADANAKSGAMARLPAAAKMRDAKSVYLAAMETIMTCEAQLRAMGVNPAPPQQNTKTAKK
jgi:HlyD family secretion protein